jgi:ribosomal protein L17
VRDVHRADATGGRMNALELLAEQHREMDEIIARIDEGDDDRQALFEDLADQLAAHSRIEETLFYPACKAAETEELLRDFVEDHLSMKRLVADMLELDVDSEEFDAKLTVLADELEHHAHEEEEGKLFPKLRKLVSEEVLRALGAEMLGVYQEALASHPGAEISRETGEAAPI